MKTIWVYLKDYKRMCDCTTFEVFKAIFELFVPLVVSGIIDIGIAKKMTILKSTIILVPLTV